MSKLLQIVSLILAFSCIACHPERYNDESSTIKNLLVAILAVAITVPVIFGLVKLFKKMYADTKKKLYEEVKAMLQADVVAQQNQQAVYQSLLGRQDDQLAYPRRSNYIPRFNNDMNKSSIERVQYLFV